jgi:hypothetical protein
VTLLLVLLFALAFVWGLLAGLLIFKRKLDRARARMAAVEASVHNLRASVGEEVDAESAERAIAQFHCLSCGSVVVRCASGQGRVVFRKATCPCGRASVDFEDGLIGDHLWVTPGGSRG